MSFGDWLSGLGLIAGTYADFKNLSYRERRLIGKRRLRKNVATGG